jgi:hypothetical protein
MMLKYTADKTLASECARRLRRQNVFCAVMGASANHVSKWGVRISTETGNQMADLEAAFRGEVVPMGPWGQD